MKKNAQYEINFASNTIIVTKRFLAAASQIGTTEFATMSELRKLQMPITVQQIHRKQRENRWSYERMERFISMVENSDSYMADFAATENGAGYMATWAWFKKTFPKYKNCPELNENHRFIVLPHDYEENDTDTLNIA